MADKKISKKFTEPKKFTKGNDKKASKKAAKKIGKMLKDKSKKPGFFETLGNRAIEKGRKKGDFPIKKDRALVRGGGMSQRGLGKAFKNGVKK
jgi:hypothetical protein